MSDVNENDPSVAEIKIDSGQDLADLHITMQPRCPMCLAEQYMPDVQQFSYAEIACGRCGQYTQRLSRAQYIGAISRAQRLRP